MNGFWLAVLAGTVAGSLGAAVTLPLAGRRIPRPAPDSALPRAPERAAMSAEGPQPDLWREYRRCEQAVSRAARAVESVSSAPARDGLLMVVRRMAAELPNVEALVELGSGLAAETGQQRNAQVLRRVRNQLIGAADRFAVLTERVLEIVLDMVAAPDLRRVHREVAVLRDQFPLLAPLSAVFAPGTGESAGLPELPALDAAIPASGS